MTTRSLLLRLRCLVPGPTQHRMLRDLQRETRCLRATLTRLTTRHEQMRVFAYDWRAQVKAADTAASDAGYAGESAATVIYTLTAQLDGTRRERDEALRVAREPIGTPTPGDL